MKDFNESDKMGKAQPAPTGTRGRQVSRAVLTEALANFAPHRKITHRTGTHLHQYSGVAISPDGSKMLTANRDRTARLWDIASGQCLMVLQEHTGELRRAAFLSDGKRAVTTADDGTLRLWDLATGASLLVFAGHKGIVTAVAACPDDKCLLSGGEDGTVRIWSLATGFQEHIINEAGAHVDKILVTGDGSSFVVLYYGNTIRRWSFPDLNGPFPVAEGHFPNRFNDIALAGNGTLVAAAWDGLYWFDIFTGARERFLSFETRKPYKVAVTRDGARLAACCHYGVILVVNHETGIVEKELAGHKDDVTGMAIAPDGKTLCTVSLDWTCRTWDMDTGQCLRILHVARKLYGLSLFGGGESLAARDEGGAAKVWNLASGRMRVVTRDVSSLAFLDLPDLIAAGLRDGRLLLLRRRGAREETVATLKAHTNPVDLLVPLRSGAFLASCGYDGLKLWDVEKSACLRTVPLPGKAMVLAIDDAAERFAVSCIFEKDICIMDLRSGQKLGLLCGHEHSRIDGVFVPIRALSFVANGSRLISSGRDGRVILWDLVSLRILQSVHDTDSDIISMVVSDDEQSVLVGTLRGRLERWELAGGQRDVVWPGEGQPILSLAQSPDGGRLFASLGDGTVRIIDHRSGVLLCSLWNVNDGFFWFTPPGAHAPDGWIWTDRDDLVHVVEESAEGKVLGAVPLADERRRTYVRTRNNAAMVQACLKGLDEYTRLAEYYAYALAGRQRETAARPLPLPARGENNA